MTTKGGFLALIVPISGIETWKSESSLRRNASNSSSAPAMYRRARMRRSISSMLARAVIPLKTTGRARDKVGFLRRQACTSKPKGAASSGAPAAQTREIPRGFRSFRTGRLRCLFYCSPGQHPRQMLFVLRAGAQVARRIETVGRVLGGLVWLGAIVQGLLNSLRPHRRRADVRQPDAPPAVHLLGGRSHDCPVEEPAAELDVLVRAVGDREHDLGDDLVGRERRSEEVLEEVLGLYRPLVGDDLGVEHQRDGRVVAGCVGVGDHATDRAYVADLVVTDLTGHLRQDWQLVLDRI